MEAQQTMAAPEPTFVGRVAELAALEEFAAHPGVVLLVGPPGVGKSRLLTEWLRGHPNAVRVSLRGVGFSGFFATLAGELRAPAVAFDESLMRAACLLHLRRQPALLIFDNAEHFAAHPHIFQDLADALPEHCIVIGSRVAWDGPLLPRTLFVKPLSSTDTALLVRTRLRAHNVLGDDAMIETMAQAVHGLPLAIEIAVGIASRVGVVHATELVLARKTHESLRAAMQVSLQMLEPGDKDLLAAAVLLGGPFALDELIEILALAKDTVLFGIERLVRASLVHHDAETGKFSPYPFVAESVSDSANIRPLYQHALLFFVRRARSARGTPYQRMETWTKLEPRIEALLFRIADDAEFDFGAVLSELAEAVACLVNLARYRHYEIPETSALRHPRLHPFCETQSEYRVVVAELATIRHRYQEALPLLLALLGDLSALSPSQQSRVYWCQAVVCFWASDMAGSRAAIARANAIVDALTDPPPHAAILRFSAAFFDEDPTGEAFQKMATIVRQESHGAMYDDVLVRDYFMGALLARGDYQGVLALYEKTPWRALGVPAAFNAELHRIYALILLDDVAAAESALEQAERNFVATTSRARALTARLALALQRGHAEEVAAVCATRFAWDEQPELVRFNHQVLVSVAMLGFANVPWDASVPTFVRARCEGLGHPQLQGIAQTMQFVLQRVPTSTLATHRADFMRAIHAHGHGHEHVFWGSHIVVALTARLCAPELGIDAENQRLVWQGQGTDLSARPALWRVLMGLVAAHRDRRVLRAEELHELAWPDEKGSTKSKENRIRVSMHYLRELGLRELIENCRPGYRLPAQLRTASVSPS